MQRALNASVGWHDDPSASVRQINGVGPTLIEKLKEGLGVESVGLTALTGLSSSRFEALAGKSHPWYIPAYSACPACLLLSVWINALQYRS